MHKSKITCNFVGNKISLLGKKLFSTERVRGMYDWFPDQMKRFNYIRDTAKRVSSLYGYDEVGTKGGISKDSGQHTNT